MEVEPLNQLQQEDLGLNTCSHNLSLSFREVPIVDELEPQSLPNFLSLDIKVIEDDFLGEGLSLPIKTKELENGRKAHLIEEKQIPSVKVHCLRGLENFCVATHRINDPNVEINDENVEHDKNIHDQQDTELELLAINALKEVEKQLILAKNVKQQNVELTKQFEKFKERVQVFETTHANKSNFHKKYIEADQQAKNLENQFQVQFIQDRDKIRALKKEIDDLQMSVSNERKQVLELKNAHTSLKHKFTDEDKYLDDILKLEAEVKNNEIVVVKMSNFVRAMFMLGPKPLSIYDPQLKQCLGYENPYTLKQAISVNPKLYDASYLYSSNVRANIHGTKETILLRMNQESN
ncbi:hypothetical protein Tco_0522637 [Tanacetum coccineum]